MRGGFLLLLLPPKHRSSGSAAAQRLLLTRQHWEKPRDAGLPALHSPGLLQHEKYSRDASLALVY